MPCYAHTRASVYVPPHMREDARGSKVFDEIPRRATIIRERPEFHPDSSCRVAQQKNDLDRIFEKIEAYLRQHEKKSAANGGTAPASPEPDRSCISWSFQAVVVWVIGGAGFFVVAGEETRSGECQEGGAGAAAARSSAPKVKNVKVHAATSVPLLKKRPGVHTCEAGFHQIPSVTSVTKPNTGTSFKDELPPQNGCSTSSVLGHPAPCSNIPSPSQSAGCSVSVDETMLTCDSMKSSDIEYIDNADSLTLASLERQASENLCISEHSDVAGHKWKRDVLMGIETIDVVDVDNNYNDPQMRATLACDIYNHLRVAETKKRPSTDFMEVLQKDINASMRAILIDWLAETMTCV